MTYKTQDEAIAAALTESEPGEVVVVHSEACKVDRDGNGCTCEPLTLKTGASS